MSNKNYSNDIEARLNKINKLLDTPHVMREYCLETLRPLLSAEGLVTSVKKPIEQAIAAIENIHDISIQRAYSIIYNQMCILAVSALSIVLEDYFRNYCNANWGTLGKKGREKISKTNIQFGVILEKGSKRIGAYLADLILKQDKSINFQDLQSIIRTFEDYSEKKISLDDGIRDDVIFAQQCRHVLVHSDGVVNTNFLEKISATRHNDRYKVGDTIELTEKDWENIKPAFKALVQQVTSSVVTPPQTQ